ncbi:MAG: M20/M25/M40 family metallo-hydrolase, partial [Pseudomonadota bacterium]
MTGARYSPRELIDKLISFDTTSHKSNLDLIAFVQDYLTGWGVESLLLPNEDGNKANLYATVGPNGPGGIVLSGHTDVVPVEGQDWSTDPFCVVERDGLLFGRGTCDMKAFLAVALAKVPDLVDRSLSTPVHLAFTYDEEVGCLG